MACSSLAFGIVLLPLTRGRAEDRADYRYENYAEDGGRIHVRTHGLLINKDLTPWLSLRGNYVYDGISGATPTGAPPLPGQSTVPKVTIDDIRRAGFIEPSFHLGNHTLTPQAAYSEESDYRSVGVSLTHSIDFNEKNTTVTWGVSHAFDRILPNPGESIDVAQDKDATDVLLGLTQVIDPQTLVRANLTLGYSDGYLSDPYKRVLFRDFPHTPGQPYTVFPENRPAHKFRQVAFLSLQHFVLPADGAAELSYRFYHDDWDVVANTLTVEWHQNVGKWVTISPIFRYYTQTAASFYGTSFAGDPSCPLAFPECPQIQIPSYYSADYRVSAFDAFTYGVSASIHLHERVSLQFEYQRYEMFGTDHMTAQDQYPQAHIFSGGISLWF